jgi:hypothetical protein
MEWFLSYFKKKLLRRYENIRNYYDECKGPTWFLYKLFTVIALLQKFSVYQLSGSVAFYCCTSIEKVQKCCMLSVTECCINNPNFKF